ncbi:MAG TPA: glycosyltransferase family 2 protein [Bacillales bacterium]|nr:glycosyltransferase family 2 protein [Bacillales bacterium]
MKLNRPEISIVTPVYKSEASLMPLYERLKRSLGKIKVDFEIIFVNDASPDNCWAIISDLAERDARVKGINLSRNFGQHHAITAGIDHVAGKWMVVMDCDLQDQPEEIAKLYQKALEGYDVVFGRRHVRQDSVWKRWPSRFFYKIYDYFTENRSDTTIANFSICSDKVVASFRRMREQNRSFPLFVKWMGFRATAVNVAHARRPLGKSSYSWRKLWNLAIDGIVAQSNKPLKLSIQFGFAVALVSFLYGLSLVYRYLFLFQPVPGWTSVMVSLYFIGGLLFANFGVIGLYIGKIFDEVKQRPLYIVQDTVGINDVAEAEGEGSGEQSYTTDPMGRESVRHPYLRP